MKFAHMGDCHLGGWRHPALKELNFKSFQTAIDRCIKEKVEFVLIAGDLFDTPYPSIDTLKETFQEFRKLKEANTPVFLIAGSHDYSVSGKTFLDVLDRAGFSKNVAVFEEHNGSVMLLPTVYKNVAIYGYPGKKSSLEVDELTNIKIQESPGLFKILMLHTAIRDAVGSLPIKAIDHEKLPKVDYLALAHLHIKYNKDRRVYSGPIFPNSLTELEELQEGSFCIFDNGRVIRHEIKLKAVLCLQFEIKSTLQATELILSRLEKENLKDKIIILKLFGMVEQGKISDIDFLKIESYIKNQGAFVFLKSTTKLYTTELELKTEFIDSIDLEQQVINKFEEAHPNKHNKFIPQLFKILQVHKIDDEKTQIFEERIFSEAKKALQL